MFASRLLLALVCLSAPLVAVVHSQFIGARERLVLNKVG
jgi:hypothetical protein